MCNGTKIHWRCKCSVKSCPRYASGDSEPGHYWDTANLGAYFFCDDYLLSGRYVIGYQGVPPCPKGVTTDFDTRFRNYLCPDCVKNGCPPIDHSIKYQASADKISKAEREQMGEQRGRSTSRSKSKSRASSTDTVRPERSSSRSKTPAAVRSPAPGAGTEVDPMRASIALIRRGGPEAIEELLKMDVDTLENFIQQVDSPQAPQVPPAVASPGMWTAAQASRRGSQSAALESRVGMWAAEQAWRQSQVRGMGSSGVGFSGDPQLGGGSSGEDFLQPDPDLYDVGGPDPELCDLDSPECKAYDMDRYKAKDT
ncbi:hypothetical protein CONLIGDRAFT_642353 [Coniochaeta ligniaria NRRL 30616]|uniref:Uncharacterized protein n=1 Tax=Coniochaeta ligniaria NRRL 30616 TaxID=1408157 RepID=A0A1J7IY34_9PEZI|nr:hypothetical protein CONLIGDRAFT_642353 [Coniochaeta ligniaria NRRL 30616]